MGVEIWILTAIDVAIAWYLIDAVLTEGYFS